MLVDITLEITAEMWKDAKESQKTELEGHLGTHFDVMDKEFPLEYTNRRGVFFDVSSVCGRDIDICDIDLSVVERDMFVGFYTGYSERVRYGEGEYFSAHPQLSDALIDALLDKEISIIGIDFAGVRRGVEHTPKDSYCAGRGVFIVENLVGLKLLVVSKDVTVNTYPIRCRSLTGLPCRVIAKVES